MIIHPTTLKEFASQNKNDTVSIKYEHTRKYQYLVCRGHITTELVGKIKKYFPGAYATNGNFIRNRRFRMNPN